MAEGRKPGRSGSTVIKRSVLIAGHPTSVSLEGAFWDGLKAIAAERGVSLTGLVTEIDGSRSAANLSSAIRVFVLGRYRDPVGAAAQDRHGSKAIPDPESRPGIERRPSFPTF